MRTRPGKGEISTLLQFAFTISDYNAFKCAKSSYELGGDSTCRPGASPTPFPLLACADRCATSSSVPAASRPPGLAVASTLTPHWRACQRIGGVQGQLGWLPPRCCRTPLLRGFWRNIHVYKLDLSHRRCHHKAWTQQVHDEQNGGIGCTVQ